MQILGVGGLRTRLLLSERFGGWLDVQGMAFTDVLKGHALCDAIDAERKRREAKA